MSKLVCQLPTDESLAAVRSLASRQHVARLSIREQNVVSLLWGLGCGQMSVDAAAERLNLTPTEVRRLHERALRKLGSHTLREAAA